MPLPTQEIELPFQSGLREDVAPEVLPAHGGWLVFENAEYGQNGEVRKRPGYGVLSANKVGGGTLLNRYWLGSSSRDELLCITHEPDHVNNHYVGHGFTLHGYFSNRDLWARRGQVPAFGHSRQPLVRNYRDLDQASTQVAVSGPYRAVAWLTSNGSRSTPGDVAVWFRVDNLETGQIVVAERKINEPSDDPTELALFASGTRFVVVWANQGLVGSEAMRVWRWNTSDLSSDTTPTDLFPRLPGATPIPSGDWDACHLRGNNEFVVVYFDPDTGDLSVRSFLTSTLVQTDAYFYTPPGGTAFTPTVHSNGTTLSVAFRAAGLVYSILLSASAISTVLWGTFAVFAAPSGGGAWAQVTTFVQSNNGCVWYAARGDDLPGEEMVRFAAYTLVGGVEVAPFTLRNQALWSRPFEPYGDGRIFLITTSYVGSSRRDAGYQIIDLYTSNTVTAFPRGWHGTIAWFGGKAQPRRNLAFPASLGQGLPVSLPVLVASEEVGNGQWDLSVLFPLNDSRSDLWHTVDAAGLVYFSGSHTVVYDGENVVEAGFVEPPLISNALAIYGASGLEGDPVLTNTYLYQAVYAWRDAAGNVHYSAPSPIQRVDISHSGSDIHASVTLTIKCTSLTRKVDTLEALGDRVYILLFRTKKNSPGGPFYKLVGSQSIPNLPYVYSTSFVDSLEDSQLESLGLGYLYTDGGVLENHPAPPSLHLAVHQNRVWAIDAEDRRTVWFTKSIVPGEAPGWNAGLTLRVDDSPDELTALASLDDVLVLFSRSRVYLVDGLGPNDQGQGPPHTVRLLSTSAGCIDARSVVRFEGGVFFQDASGLMLLAKGAAVPVPAGDPVRSTLDAHPTIKRACHDPKRRRIFWLCKGDDISLVVVYDYRHQAWYTWTYGHVDEVTGQTFWRDIHLIHDVSEINFQAAGGYDRDTWIPLRIRTPWLHLGALGGYQRLRKFVLLGERQTECSLLVRLFTDHDDTTVKQSWTWDLGSTSDLQGLPRLALRHHLGTHQTSRVASLEFADAPPPDFDRAVHTGVSLYGLTLQLGVKPGLARLPATNKR